MRERTSRLDLLLDKRASTLMSDVRPEVEAALAGLRRAGACVEIFGSAARGEFRLHSDIDFLVEDKGALSELDVFNLVSGNLKSAPFNLVFSDRVDQFTLRLMRDDAKRI